MEGVTALGLAGNITQFLEFGLKFCRTVNEIYHSASGITKHNTDVETLTNDFVCSLDKIEDDLTKYCAFLSGDASIEANKAGQREVHPVVEGCRRVAFTILDRLERLKADRQVGKWKSFLAAVKALWRQEELQDLERQLEGFRAELQWIIVVSLRTSLDMLESRQQDQFRDLQSSMTGILSEVIQYNSRRLPEWSMHIHTYQQRQRNPLSNSESILGDAAFSPDEPSRTNTTEVEGPHSQLAADIARQLARADKNALDNLDFPVMYDRETEIASGEAATFDWIFHDPRDSDRPWSNFHDWLSDNRSDRLYWINGKAGSGKSTLMKHLVHHENTKQALRQWAGGTKLLLSSFFFWYSGHELQKSQSGLLRALLFSCLKGHRELIPIVLPVTAGFRDFHECWTVVGLRGALDRLVSQTTFDIKFAFFIDGLDEYAGNYPEMIEILKGISTRDNVKVCVSSRPLIAFERAFAKSPQLILQNLTHNDIGIYVDNKLSQNDRMKELEREERGLCDELTASIVKKASGVFLWVYLVVGSLLDGLGNYDVGADLKRRLDYLPAELEALYWHMLERVKPAWYLEEGFRLLRMVKAASGNATLLQLCLAEMPEELVHRPGLLTEPSLERQQALCHDMAGRLKSRCLGLLEASGNESEPTNQTVSFIHKSVFDFLETDAAQSRIKACPGHDTFQPDVALLRADILALKMIPSLGKSVLTRDDWFTRIRPRIIGCLRLAREAERTSGLPNVELLRTLEEVGDLLWASFIPRTSDEESGEVHWASVGRSATRPIPGVTIRIEVKEVKPLKSFDHLCQRNGLDLYAEAIGLEPFNTLDRGITSDHQEGSLRAAEEIWSQGPQAPVVHESTMTSMDVDQESVLESVSGTDPRGNGETILTAETKNSHTQSTVVFLVDRENSSGVKENQKRRVPRFMGKLFQRIAVGPRNQ